jgi:outer membrane protein OmpA-like peptidoglycan-associated protein
MKFIFLFAILILNYFASAQLSLVDHKELIRCVDWSPDGKMIATGSHDSTIKIWDGNSGILIRTLKVSTPVISLCWSPDGKSIASSEIPAKIYNLYKDKIITISKKDIGYINSISWSPDGKKIALASCSKVIYIFDVNTGNENIINTYSKYPLCYVKWSPDCSMIVTGDGEGIITIWDANKYNVIRSINDSSSISSISWSPDSKRIVFGSVYKVTLLDVNSGNREYIRDYSDNFDTCPMVVWSPDGSKIAIKSNTKIKFWGNKKGKINMRIPEDRLNCWAMSWSPDSKRIAVSSNSIVKIWPLNVVIKGKIHDSKNIPVIADIKVKNINDNSEEIFLKSNERYGEYQFQLDIAKQYEINYECNNYFSVSKFVDLLKSTIEDTIILDVTLNTIKEIKLGKSITINNIFFEYGKSDLKPESFSELDRLVKFLLQNPDCFVEISGHTDNVGDKSYNLKLSQDRATTVVNYLIKKGCNRYKLKAKGYGFSKPIASNDTDEGQAANRRVEFKVITQSSDLKK